MSCAVCTLYDHDHIFITYTLLCIDSNAHFPLILISTPGGEAWYAPCATYPPREGLVPEKKYDTKAKHSFPLLCCLLRSLTTQAHTAHSRVHFACGMSKQNPYQTYAIEDGHGLVPPLITLLTASRCPWRPCQCLSYYG